MACCPKEICQTCDFHAIIGGSDNKKSGLGPGVSDSTVVGRASNWPSLGGEWNGECHLGSNLGNTSDSGREESFSHSVLTCDSDLDSPHHATIRSHLVASRKQSQHGRVVGVVIGLGQVI